MSDLQQMTIREVAAALAVSRGRACEILRQNRIPVVRFGPRTLRVSREAVRKLVEGKG